MPGARWFPDARLNFAENLLARARAATMRPTRSCFAARTSDRAPTVARASSCASTSRIASALRRLGIVRRRSRRRRTCPNMPETIVAMLAATSRRRHLVVVLAGFRRAGRARPLRPDRAARARSPSTATGTTARRCRSSTRSPRSSPGCRPSSAWSSFPISSDSGGPLADLSRVRGAVRWDDFLAPHAAATDRLRAPAVRPSALHPVFVGHDRRAEVHRARRRRHAAAASQGASAARRHEARRPPVLLHDLRLDDVELAGVRARARARRCCCTTARRSSTAAASLWDFARGRADHALRHVGEVHRRAEEDRRRAAQGLRARRSCARCSPPAARSRPESFDYVYQCVKDDLCLSSISGGTDIVSCFALGNPTLPVWRGELQCRGLGMAVDVYDDEGRPIPSGRRARRAGVHRAVSVDADRLLERPRRRAATAPRISSAFPGVWCHGDYVELTEHDGMIIYGRSDATLNPGRRAHRHRRDLSPGRAAARSGREPRDRPGLAARRSRRRARRAVRASCATVSRSTTRSIDRISAQIRANTTPRHVPAKVVQVTDIPRTKSNKIVELAVRNVVHGLDGEEHRGARQSRGAGAVPRSCRSCGATPMAQRPS